MTDAEIFPLWQSARASANETGFLIVIDLAGLPASPRLAVRSASKGSGCPLRGLFYMAILYGEEKARHHDGGLPGQLKRENLRAKMGAHCRYSAPLLARIDLHPKY